MRDRWAQAGLRLVAPAAALLLLAGIVRGIPCPPPAAPYLLGALVAAAVCIAVRRESRWPISQALWAAAALWLATSTSLWRLEAAGSGSRLGAERRLHRAVDTLTRRFDREVRRLDSLMEEVGRRSRSPAGQALSPEERWRRAVAAARVRRTEGVALYHDDETLLAWGGESMAASPELLSDASVDRTLYGLAMQGEDAHLFAARRVGGDLVLATERRVASETLVRAPPLAVLWPETTLEFQARESARRAYGDFFARRSVYRPRGQGGDTRLLFALRAPDGKVLALGRVRDLPPERCQASIAGFWQDVGLLGAAVFLLLGLRRQLIGFPSLSGAGTLLGASALIWALRWLLSRAGFPHLPLLRPLFDYSDYSSPLLGRWSLSPGDLLLTVVAGLVQAALLYAAAGALRRRERAGRLRAAAGWGSLVAGGLAAAAALGSLVHTLVRDSRPVLLGVSWRDPEASELVLQMSLFAGASALALGVLALGRWSCRRCLARSERRWFGSLPPGRRLVLLSLLGVAAVTLAYYPQLLVESEAIRRRLVQSTLLPEILNQGWKREVVLRESLRKVLLHPDLAEVLRAAPREPDPAIAYRLWSDTELAALGYESSLRIVDARGRSVSRFGLNLPEAFEQQLQRTILAGPGPARARVRLLSIDKPILFGRRPVVQGDTVLGAVEIAVSENYDNVPFVFTSNPYTLLFRTSSAALTESVLLGAPPHFSVYNAETQATLFSSDPVPPPPLSAALAERLEGASGPVWRSLSHGRQRLRLLYSRRDDEVFAIGYQRENAIHVAAGWLQACIQNVVFAGVLAAALSLAIAPAAFRRSLRDLRPPAQGQTFYRRLLVTLLLASLIPLVALTLFLEGMLAHEIRQEVQRLGSTALTAPPRLVSDYLATVSPGQPTVDDNLLYYLSQVTRQDIHIYRGPDLHATSRPELFSSGLLPARLRGDVYRDLVEERLPASLREERIGSQRFYVISGRLALLPPLSGNWIVSLPLGLQQGEVEGKLREVREAILLTSALLVLLLSVLSYAAAARIARPIAEVGSAARRLASGDLEVRVERRAEAELQALIDVFNRMARAIREQQEDLRARRDYIEKILLNATTGVVSCDARGRVVTANPSACRLTGATLEPGTPLGPALEAAGLSDLAEILPGEAPGGPGTWAGGFAERREEVAIGAGEEERRLRAVLVPLREQQRPAGGLLLLEDITENVRSNRLRAWAEMAQRIAHEIKNPLTPIQLSAEHLKHVFRDQPAEFARVLDECVRTITEQVRALRQIAREFSTYARIPEIRPERVDLREVVEEALAPYTASAPPGLLIERRWEEGTPSVRVDRNLLRRALVNLLENSLEALDGRGKIRVGLQAVSLDGRRRVRLTVDDNGPGIEPSVLPRLFEPFFSTKGSGTGLGLAIARQAVEANGGTIHVERPEGPRGTRMVILLPAAEE